ncbi:MAG: hypothetical protein KDK04_11330 [Candidatus Competibacteraceae bacterium]|nr:hypothetical protein [Candidatus Competibacteraceae bacterium]
MALRTTRDVPDSLHCLNALSELGLKAQFKRDLNKIFKVVYRKYKKTEEGRRDMMTEIEQFARERVPQEYTWKLPDKDLNQIIELIYSLFCARYEEYQQRAKERREKFDAGLEKSLRAGYTDPKDKESKRAAANASFVPGSAYSNSRKH